MSTEPNLSNDAAEPADGVDVRASASRHRLQQVFDRGKRSLERADYDYAHDLFGQCVAGDPGSLVYLQHFRANLAQMHPGASMARSVGFGGLRGFGGRGAVAKAAAKHAWADAFGAGCRLLKKSPRDTQVLSEMAAACRELGHHECGLYYLRWALDLTPTDIEINRQAAALLEKVGQYDQAIGCWVRVQQQKPGDEEANKAISRLSVEKTIDNGKYNPALLSGGSDPDLPRALRVSEAAVGTRERTETQVDKPDEGQLRSAIDADPTDPAPYTQLAELYIGEGRLQDAELLLGKALKVAGGGDLSLLEKLEDVYLTRMRERAASAQRRATKQASAAAAKLAEQALREANEAEAQVFAARVQRTPADARLQHEYGLRLKRIGKHREAIEPFQAARADKKRLAEVQLHLGECFQQIEQHQLAIRSYEAAIAACPAEEWTDLRKLALYRAGVLAMGLNQLDAAETHLTELAAADFGYRDVGERLDKIARIRQST